MSKVAGRLEVSEVAGRLEEVSEVAGWLEGAQAVAMLIVQIVLLQDGCQVNGIMQPLCHHRLGTRLREVSGGQGKA